MGKQLVSNVIEQEVDLKHLSAELINSESLPLTSQVAALHMILNSVVHFISEDANPFWNCGVYRLKTDDQTVYGMIHHSKKTSGIIFRVPLSYLNTLNLGKVFKIAARLHVNWEHYFEGAKASANGKMDTLFLDLKLVAEPET